MTDFENLYARFQIDQQSVSEMQALYALHQEQCTRSEKVIVTTSVSDESGTKIVKKEVANAELV
jgi:hypothetical protein